MANEKYDNVDELLDTGTLDWVRGPIQALLMQNFVFNASHQRLFDGLEGSSKIAVADVPGRAVSDDGDFLGWPVSFNHVSKNTDYQVLLTLSDGSADPWLLSYFDEDAVGNPLRLTNNGTLIVRPVGIEDPDPPILGLWLKP